MRNSDWPFPVSVPGALTVAKYAGIAVGAYLLYKLVLSKGVLGASSAVTRGVLDAGAGVVVGAGEAIGIPQTDQDKCAEAIYAGRTWDASFACPAATFLRWSVGGVLPSPPPASSGLSGAPRARRKCCSAEKVQQRLSANRNC